MTTRVSVYLTNGGVTGGDLMGGQRHLTGCPRIHFKLLGFSPHLTEDMSVHRRPGRSAVFRRGRAADKKTTKKTGWKPMLHCAPDCRAISQGCPGAFSTHPQRRRDGVKRDRLPACVHPHHNDVFSFRPQFVYKAQGLSPRMRSTSAPSLRLV